MNIKPEYRLDENEDNRNWIYGEDIENITIPPIEDFADGKTDSIYFDFDTDGKQTTLAIDPRHLMGIFYSHKQELNEAGFCIDEFEEAQAEEEAK